MYYWKVLQAMYAMKYSTYKKHIKDIDGNNKTINMQYK